MSTLWKIWVTVSLAYLLLGRAGMSHGASWAWAKGVEWCVETGARAIAWDEPRPQDIVITPCNRDASCEVER